MNNILYNNIKEVLLNKYNIIQNINIEGGGFKPFDISTEVASTTLSKFKDFDNIGEIPDKLAEYKKRLEYLIGKVDDKIKLYNDGQIEDKIKIGKYISDLVQNPKFKSILDKYNANIATDVWNGERINKEIYAQDELELNNIYLKSAKEDLVDFNRQLLLLFNPYIENFDSINKAEKKDQTRLLNDNLVQEIAKLEELINIANEFNNYIDNKRKVIDDIIKVEYQVSDITFIDNTDKTIPESDYIKELKEASVPEESKLDLKALNEIEIIINNSIERMQVDDEMKKLRDFNIINQTDDLNKLLDISDVVIVNQSNTTTTQSGGVDDPKFTTPYIITEETNKNLFKLLKLFEKLCSLIENVIDDSKYLKELKYRYNFHIAFLFGIIRQSASKDTMIIYNYLTKDKVKLYINVLTQIMNSFSTIVKSDNNTEYKNTIYLNKYHYLNIEKIINVLTFILTHFPSDNHIVNINDCKDKILNDLTIFNHFRSILINYVNSDEGKKITGLENSNNL